jgi:hypothetical protein
MRLVWMLTKQKYQLSCHKFSPTPKHAPEKSSIFMDVETFLCCSGC